MRGRSGRVCMYGDMRRVAPSAPEQGQPAPVQIGVYGLVDALGDLRSVPEVTQTCHATSIPRT